MNASNCQCDAYGLNCQHSGKRAANKAQRDILQAEIGMRSLSDATSEHASVYSGEPHTRYFQLSSKSAGGGKRAPSITTASEHNIGASERWQAAQERRTA